MIPRHFLNGASLVGALTALFFFARLILTPDPGADFFAKAQQLEAAGQIPLALRHYRLVSQKAPESLFAPRALLRQGDLLTALGRQTGRRAQLREAIAAYASLAREYPSDALAGEALFDAAAISTDLKDYQSARGFYGQVLKNSSPKSEESGRATLQIGRLALVQNDGKGAQTLFQRVLQGWPKSDAIGAEAQFHLGVAYETLFKKREWATNAYEATIKRYPLSTWANDARGRLGLLAFADSQGRRPARRVMLAIEPLPDEDEAPLDAASPWNALRPLLAARGVEADDASLRAWSLTPFWVALDKNNLGRVVKPGFDAFENVVANAGMRLTVKGGGRQAEALRDLQDDLDAARTVLVWTSDEKTGRWSLCVGYDSDRGEVMLQSRGARFDTLATSAFSRVWKSQSSYGKPYTMVSLVTEGERNRPAPQLTPTPEPSPQPNQTPLPKVQSPPAFVWQLPLLKRDDVHRRTLRRASILVNRAGQGPIAQGIAGLDFLARELALVARPQRPLTPIPTAFTPVQFEPTPPEPAQAIPQPDDPFDAPVRAPETEPTSAPDSGAVRSVEPPLQATPVPAATPQPRRNPAARAKRLASFFGAPAREWANKRRECAAWCDLVGQQLESDELKQAARAWERSATALETAISEAPLIGEELTDENRESLRELARLAATARDAEREAARLMRRE